MAMNFSDFCEEVEEEEKEEEKVTVHRNQRVRLLATPDYRNPKVDLISNLPDSIIIHILSFLPTIEEVIRTGILSKRWQYIWTWIPSLVFLNYKQRPVSDFASFVDKTLVQCRHFKKFKVFCDAEDSELASVLRRWISYAVNCNVEVLEFSFYDPNLLLELPDCLYTSNTLTGLELIHCNFAPGHQISWKLLKKLTIWTSVLSDDVIQDMMSGCAVLEVLELCDCHGFNRLDVTSVTVKKLALKGYSGPRNTEDGAHLQISAPHILSLDIESAIFLRKLLLVNVQSLVEASLDFVCCRDNMFDIDEAAGKLMMKGLLQSLHHVNGLAIGERCMEIISFLELNGWHSPLSKRKSLKIGEIRRSAFPGLLNLLEGSPDLETLHINAEFVSHISPCCFYTRKNYLTCQKRIFRCLQQHLKTVRFSSYNEWDHRSELVQFLLGNACVLEKMIIHYGSKAGEELHLGLPLKLLTFPRISAAAVVIFQI